MKRSNHLYFVFTVLVLSSTLGVAIRLVNISLLQGDVFDPDSARYLRQAKLIVEGGGLPEVDHMRTANRLYARAPFLSQRSVMRKLSRCRWKPCKAPAKRVWTSYPSGLFDVPYGAEQSEIRLRGLSSENSALERYGRKR